MEIMKQMEEMEIIMREIEEIKMKKLIKLE